MKTIVDLPGHVKQLDVPFGGADLTDCDREPIRTPGSIQPHGVLLAVDPVNLVVMQAAGDTQRLLGIPLSRILGCVIDETLGVQVRDRIATLVKHDQLLPRPFFVADVRPGDIALDVSAYLSGGLVVLEIEQRPSPAMLDGVSLIQKMIGTVQMAGCLANLLNGITCEVQQACGFDRVMLYRFDGDGSGHVVAEAVSSENIDSFLDLHYPATDIPAQARALYCSCWIRYVPDVGYSPQRLHPDVNPSTGRSLDMSFGLLRSVSPVHLEYLANMGVAASMSLSIVIDGQLWGLIACHHQTPRYLDCRLRAALELFAQLSSLQIKARLETELAAKRANARSISSSLVASMTQQGLSALLDDKPNLLDLLPADGVAVVVDGVVSVLGATPDRASIDSLTSWLNGTMDGGIYSTSHLRNACPTIPNAQTLPPGLLALSISRSPSDYVLWFLPETVTTVKWGGKPDKIMTPGPLGDRLTPRKSFEAWVEEVRDASRPWTPVEIETATLLRVSVLEIVLKNVDLFAREQQSARAHQALLMAELDHRVKNTLATIQALVRSSKESATDLVEYTLSLEGRLRSMARTHDLLTETHWEGAPLRLLVESELSAYRPLGDPHLDIRGDNIELEPKAAITLALVLHELATNAAKYGSLSSDDGRIRVKWTVHADRGTEWLRLDWTESDGPLVSMPINSGFGRTLLEKAFAYDIRGYAKLSFDPDGVHCLLEIPAGRIVRPNRG